MGVCWYSRVLAGPYATTERNAAREMLQQEGKRGRQKGEHTFSSLAAASDPTPEIPLPPVPKRTIAPRKGVQVAARSVGSTDCPPQVPKSAPARALTAPPYRFSTSAAPTPAHFDTPCTCSMTLFVWLRRIGPIRLLLLTLSSRGRWCRGSGDARTPSASGG
jgi:hypothetical protein